MAVTFCLIVWFLVQPILCDTQFKFHPLPGSNFIEYISSIDIEKTASSLADKIIFAIHDDRKSGATAAAQTTHQAIYNVVSAGKYNNIIIIVPIFTEQATSQDQIVYDKTSDWINGAVSSSPPDSHISSYEVIDKFLQFIFDHQAGRFPHLSEIVLLGHGDGAQFVQLRQYISVLSDTSRHIVNN